MCVVFVCMLCVYGCGVCMHDIACVIIVYGVCINNLYWRLVGRPEDWNWLISFPVPQALGGFMTPYPGAMSVAPGTMTPGFATSSRIDLNQIGEARNSILGIKLDQVIL